MCFNVWIINSNILFSFEKADSFRNQASDVFMNGLYIHSLKQFIQKRIQ